VEVCAEAVWNIAAGAQSFQLYACMHACRHSPAHTARCLAEADLFVWCLQLFFAKVPRTATQQQIQDVFARFGEVVSLNLFTPYEVSLCWNRTQQTVCVCRGANVMWANGQRCIK
jgi:hypothetical protein